MSALFSSNSIGRDTLKLSWYLERPNQKGISWADASTNGEENLNPHLSDDFPCLRTHDPWNLCMVKRVPIRKTFWRWAAPAYTTLKLTFSKQVLPPGVLSQFTSSKKPSSAVWILWLFSLPHFLMDHPVLLLLFFARTPTFILPPIPTSSFIH